MPRNERPLPTFITDVLSRAHARSRPQTQPPPAERVQATIDYWNRVYGRNKAKPQVITPKTDWSKIPTPEIPSEVDFPCGCRVTFTLGKRWMVVNYCGNSQGNCDLPDIL